MPLSWWLFSLVKNFPAVRETWVPCLGWEDSLEKEGIGYPLLYSFAWRIQGTEEPGGLQCMGSRRVGQVWAIKPRPTRHYARFRNSSAKETGSLSKSSEEDRSQTKLMIGLLVLLSLSQIFISHVLLVFSFSMWRTKLSIFSLFCFFLLQTLIGLCPRLMSDVYTSTRW